MTAGPSAPRTTLNDTTVLSVLTIGVAVVAVAMVILGRASALEAVSFVTGAICVWLTVKENVWNFPMGMLNAATFSVVFWKARLFGDSALQVVYFVMNFMGWYLWLYGGERRTALHVTRASRLERWLLAFFIVAGTLLLWKTLRLVGGSSSFGDAATTAVSLGAQWLMNRKRLETWYLWIVVDIAYIPLYFSRDLHLTALLYAVFLVMATMGLKRWRSVWASAGPEPATPTSPATATSNDRGTAERM